MNREEQTYLWAPPEYWVLTIEEIEKIIESTGGCGPGGFGDYLVPDTLFGVINIKPACRIHDYMYATGEDQEDKDYADEVFLSNMKQIILWETAGWYEDKKRQTLVRKECFRQAETYHMIVHLFGHLFFDYKDEEEA